MRSKRLLEIAEKRCSPALMVACLAIAPIAAADAGKYVIGGGVGYENRILNDEWPTSLKHGASVNGFGGYRFSEFLEIDLAVNLGLAFGSGPLFHWDPAPEKDVSIVAETFGISPKLLGIKSFGGSEIFCGIALGLHGRSEQRQDGKDLVRHEYKAFAFGVQPSIGYRINRGKNQLYFESAYAFTSRGKIDHSVDAAGGATDGRAASGSHSLSGLALSFGIAFRIDRRPGW